MVAVKPDASTASTHPRRSMQALCKHIYSSTIITYVVRIPYIDCILTHYYSRKSSISAVAICCYDVCVCIYGGEVVQSRAFTLCDSRQSDCEQQAANKHAYTHAAHKYACSIAEVPRSSNPNIRPHHIVHTIYTYKHPFPSPHICKNIQNSKAGRGRDSHSHACSTADRRDDDNLYADDARRRSRQSKENNKEKEENTRRISAPSSCKRRRHATPANRTTTPPPAPPPQERVRAFPTTSTAPREFPLPHVSAVAVVVWCGCGASCVSTARATSEQPTVHVRTTTTMPHAGRFVALCWRIAGVSQPIGSRANPTRARLRATWFSASQQFAHVFSERERESLEKNGELLVGAHILRLA